MIEVDRQGAVWTVTLNRPDKANALTEEMLRALLNAMTSAREAAAVILTGRGAVFSAGADLEAARAGLATSDVWEDLSGAIADLPGLSIAALNGTLAGGAFGMALACDLRFAPPQAKFFYPVMKHGFLPQPSDPVRLAALVGPARAKLILLAGQKIDAERALQMGLIDELVPADEIATRAQELTAHVAGASQPVAQQIKRMCVRG